MDNKTPPIIEGPDDDPSTGIGGMTAFDLIVSLRGGFPDKCDFCRKHYGLTVHHTNPHGDQGRFRTTNPSEAADWQQHIEYVLGFPSWITQRYPIPEEASEWACNECYARWRAEGVPGYA